MDYIFYFGLVICLLRLYDYAAITVAILHQYFASRQPYRSVYYISFYTARIIRAYIYASILLTFANHYIETGLSPVWILGISYLGLVLWWFLEISGVEFEEDSDSIEYDLIVNQQLIIIGIYTAVLCFLYVTDLQSEPYLSKFILNIVVFLSDFLIIKLAVIAWGIFFLFISGWHIIFPSTEKR